jgi:hypothetical protein
VSRSPDRLDVFATGAGPTPWWWQWNGSSWSAPTALPTGGLPGPIPAESLCAISTGDGLIDVFAAGPGNRPWSWWWTGTKWEGPAPLSMDADLHPVPLAAVKSGPDTLDVFAAGKGDTPWWWRRRGGTWGPAVPLPADAKLHPVPLAVVSARTDWLDVFAAGDGKQLWHWSNHGGSNWTVTPRGGNLPAEGVAAVSWGPDRIDVFAAALKNVAEGDTGNPLQHWWWDGTSFHGPEKLGGDLRAGTVSAVSRGPNRLEVHGVSADGGLVRWRWDGSRWTGPNARGRNVREGDVSAVFRRPNRNDIFVRGMDNSLQQYPGGGLETATQQPWANWPGNQKGAVKGHCYPGSLDELVTIVKEAEQRGGRVRAVGSSWSASDVAITPDYLVETHQLDSVVTEVLSADPGALNERGSKLRLVHVEAGITLDKLNRLLDGRDLALPTMGGASGQTLAGAVSTSVHGCDFDRGPLPDMVRAIHLVGPGGVQHWIEPTNGITDRSGLSTALGLDAANIHYDDDWFNAALVSVGSLGIIYSMIIEVVPQHDLVEQTEHLSWDAARERLRTGAAFSGKRAVQVAVCPFKQSNGARPSFLTTRTEAVKSTAVVSGGGGLPTFLASTLVGMLNINPAAYPMTVTDLTFRMIPAGRKKGLAHTVMASPDPGPLPGMGLEFAFDASNEAYLSFVDAALQVLDTAYQTERLGWGGWISLRFVGRSQAYLSPQHQFARTCMVEFAAVSTLTSTKRLLDQLEAAGRAHGGIQHWGMFYDLKAADVERAYPRLDTFREVRWELTNHGTLRTFDNDFTERCGLSHRPRLEPLGRGRPARGVALLRQAPGWNTIPTASGKADGGWSVSNGGASQFIQNWAHEPGVRLVPGDFNGNGLTDIALVRQTPGWSTLPIAFASGAGTWNITNGAANPWFISDWAHHPGVRVVPGDFNGNGLTDIALVCQTPGWSAIPIAFSNGDGSWTVTNGPAPEFIRDWAHQPGVRLVAGDFNGNGLTDIALIRQTPGWGTMPIAFANGDGTWSITNGGAPQFITDWAHQPGVRVVFGDFNGNGLTDIALVRQTPGWSTIPIAFANGDGTWKITNGSANPWFISDWAHQPGVRVVAGDFNGNGLTDIALISQRPGWSAIPIAFSKGDGTWNITNGPAPEFIPDWAHQPGVRAVAGDFNGNGLTDIALIRQTPGWGTIPVASAKGDGTWSITNGAAPNFIPDWAHQPGVRLVPGTFA